MALVKPVWALGGGALVYALALIGESWRPEAPAVGIGLLFAARGLGTGIGPIAARAGVAERNWPVMFGLGLAATGLCYLTGRLDRLGPVAAGSRRPGARPQRRQLGGFHRAAAEAHTGPLPRPGLRHRMAAHRPGRRPGHPRRGGCCCRPAGPHCARQSCASRWSRWSPALVWLVIVVPAEKRQQRAA